MRDGLALAMIGLLIWIPFAGFANGRPAGELKREDFSVFDPASGERIASLGQSIHDVVEAYGEPDRIEDIETHPQYMRYHYQGFTLLVTRSDREVALIWATGATMKTARGVSVGDPRTEVEEKYPIGFYRWDDSMQGGYALPENPFGTALFLSFRFSGEERVEDIRLGFATQ